MTKAPLHLVPAILMSLVILTRADVVINEIHYAPNPNNEAVEFIELFNSGEEAVDLAGWQFTDGFAFTFADGTVIEPGNYFILAQNRAEYDAKFGSIFVGGIKADAEFASGRLSDGGEEITLRNAADEVMDRVNYDDGFPWPVMAGGDGPSMELIHPSLDNDLGGSWRSSSEPTPGKQNSVYSETAAPQIRQVKHLPHAPLPGGDVIVSAKVTDPEGVNAVTLRYQSVEPGKYIPIDDDAFAMGWTDIAMVDDGVAPDELAGDDVYTVSLSGELQKHRHLIRYQITVADSGGAAMTVPYPDDGQPNFAYFCHGEMPSWTGAVEPGETEEVTFDPELLQSVPVYHLITTKENHVTAQHIPGTSQNGGYGGSDYRWRGTLVYDGDVYDHISFRARGGVWRYAMGKNMWKFLFNRSHEFQARDAQGRKYPNKWKRLNFSAIIQQGNFRHRGEQGLFESVGFDLFRMAGVPAPHTHYVHFRIVENGAESNIFGNQYGTDFQGLYLAIEQIDSRFLRTHGMEDGNIYKMENGTGEGGLGGELKNLAEFPAVSDYSDLRAFKREGYERTANSSDLEWWRANFHIENYVSYRSILEYIHHYDTGAGKNYYYYHDHLNGLWQILPWDLDLTWDDGMFSTGSPHRFSTTALNIDEYERDYQNRLVELADLLYNEEQTGLLIDERASAVYAPGEVSLVDADRMMWDYNPIMKSRYVNASKSGQGRYYQVASTKDFAGMIERMKNYITHRQDFARDRLIDEAKMPKAPTVSFIGNDQYQVHDLHFETSDFSGGSIFAPQAFGALKWRLAEITDVTATDFSPEPPNKYEIEADWESDVITEFNPTISIPSDVVRPGRVYRVRARMMNTGQFWSPWSEPVQFVAGQPEIEPFLNQLVISEIMYRPTDATVQELGMGFVTADFEFIELLNIGSDALDLKDVRFTKGVDYDFKNADPSSIGPGERVLLVRNRDAFVARYGEGLPVIGEYLDSKLDNNGERLKLSFGAGIAIRDMDYDHGNGWPELGKGQSLSLVDTETLTDHALAGSWGVSTSEGGTPGLPDDGVVNPPSPSGSFAQWVADHFTDPERANATISGPLADPDHDGWVNLQEFGLAGLPKQPDGSLIRVRYLLVDGERRPHMTYRTSVNAAGVTHNLEISRELNTWQPYTAEAVSVVANEDGTTTINQLLEGDGGSHWRLVTTLP